MDIGERWPLVSWMVNKCKIKHVHTLIYKPETRTLNWELKIWFAFERMNAFMWCASSFHSPRDGCSRFRSTLTPLRGRRFFGGAQKVCVVSVLLGESTQHVQYAQCIVWRRHGRCVFLQRRTKPLAPARPGLAARCCFASGWLQFQFSV